ncbi:MAG: ABC transporter permease [Planctomycetota bacterium]|nr:MAG: ABC transporter permease [Planctomycetota bacterium]
MIAGPIFVREVLTAPRRLSHYLMRSGFVAGLLILFYSIRQATIGFQDVLFAGDVASFSAMTFNVFALLQLTLGMFFATVFTASNIAQEKDRKTLILLLMTDLRNHELAVGKLFASLLIVGVLLTTSLPVFCFLKLLGGITWSQILWAEAVVGAAALAAGCWGCFVAFWREKTFQTLAISVLGIVLFVLVAHGLGAFANPSFALASPYAGMIDVLAPSSPRELGPVFVSALPTVGTLLVVSLILSILTITRLRRWNPSREFHQSVAESIPMTAKVEGGLHAADSEVLGINISPIGRVHRNVWDSPIIWREMKTRAYGRRMIWIKLAYVTLGLLIASSAILTSSRDNSLILGMVTAPAFAFLGIGILSLLLTNAQAVTSITNERDGGTLEILLVTDLRPHEFILGKIGGALWNAREMLLMPLVMIMGMALLGSVPTLTLENVLYLSIAFLVLNIFAVTLGIHAGLTYQNSRTAIANSLGTMFFLFIGIFIFMLLLVEARSSFAIQLQSFILFIGFGSLGLYSSLTHRNPSGALTLASVMLPFLTFYAITDFLLGGNLGVCFWICMAYGFTAVAMTVPAMNDFDIALGRNAGE